MRNFIVCLCVCLCAILSGCSSATPTKSSYRAPDRALHVWLHPEKPHECSLVIVTTMSDNKTRTTDEFMKTSSVTELCQLVAERAKQTECRYVRVWACCASDSKTPDMTVATQLVRECVARGLEASAQ